MAALPDVNQFAGEQRNVRELPFVESMYAADLRQWRVKIRGPKDTPYQGGLFVIELEYNAGRYAAAPPKRISMKTEIFHINFSNNKNEDLGLINWKLGNKCLSMISTSYP